MMKELEHPLITSGLQYDNQLFVPYKDYQALQAENKRLREALKNIVAHSQEWDSNKMGTVQLQRKRWLHLGKLANTALARSSSLDAARG